MIASTKSVTEFEEILNSMHPNIVFTTELLSKNRLSFLSVEVDNNGLNLVTFFFRNPLIQVYTQNGTVLCLVDLKSI